MGNYNSYNLQTSQAIWYQEKCLLKVFLRWILFCMDRLKAIYRMISYAHTIKPVPYLTTQMAPAEKRLCILIPQVPQNCNGQIEAQITSNCTRYITLSYMFQFRSFISNFFWLLLWQPPLNFHARILCQTQICWWDLLHKKQKWMRHTFFVYIKIYKYCIRMELAT